MQERVGSMTGSAGRRTPILAAAAATFAAALVACGATEGRAEGRPATMPTRDVDVTYQMAAPGPSGGTRMLTQRSRWDIGAGLLRVDPPSPGVYTVMNYPEHKLLVVREADRSVLIMHTGSASVAPGVSRSAEFSRRDSATVAGLPCTDWQTRDTGGRPRTVCLTDDGVLLRAKSGDQVLVQAVRVAYGPIDPAVFTPPPGYRPVTPPQ